MRRERPRQPAGDDGGFRISPHPRATGKHVCKSPPRRTRSLQWNSFNIAAGETTVFHQPSATSIVFNNINNANPTTIFRLLAGQWHCRPGKPERVLLRPQRLCQGRRACGDDGGDQSLVLGGGAGWSFDGPPVGGARLSTMAVWKRPSGGSLFLIAKSDRKQRNHCGARRHGGAGGRPGGPALRAARTD